jgi:hypothetical protein
MYLTNKYTHWYYNIIHQAQTRTLTGYFERHHIIPKSLGGNNSTTNLVNLTAREHFICHWLLVKMTTGINKQKMANACNIMLHGTGKGQDRYTLTSKIYENLKVNLSTIRKGRKNPKVSNSLSGRTLTTQHKLNVSAGRKGQQLSEESLNKIRKLYVVTFPNGTIEQTNNLTEFCKTHKLSLPAMRDQVAKGKQKHHNGYYIKSIPKT